MENIGFSKFNFEDHNSSNKKHKKHKKFNFGNVEFNKFQQNYKKNNQKKKNSESSRGEGSRGLMIYMLICLCFGMLLNPFPNDLDDSCVQCVCSAEYDFITPIMNAINYRIVESNYPIEQIGLI